MATVPSQETTEYSRWDRLAPLSGVLYVVLAIAGTLLIGNFSFLAPAEEIKAFYEDNSSRIEAGIYVSTPAVFFFFWFVGVVRDRLRAAEGGAGQLSGIAFGGGVAAGALMLAPAPGAAGRRR